MEERSPRVTLQQLALQSALAVIVAWTATVAVHEFGHLIVAVVSGQAVGGLTIILAPTGAAVYTATAVPTADRWSALTALALPVVIGLVCYLRLFPRWMPAIFLPMSFFYPASALIVASVFGHYPFDFLVVLPWLSQVSAARWFDGSVFLIALLAAAVALRFLTRGLARAMVVSDRGDRQCIIVGALSGLAVITIAKVIRQASPAVSLLTGTSLPLLAVLPVVVFVVVGLAGAVAARGRRFLLVTSAVYLASVPAAEFSAVHPIALIAMREGRSPNWPEKALAGDSFALSLNSAEDLEKVNDYSGAAQKWSALAHLSPSQAHLALRTGRALVLAGQYSGAEEPLLRARGLARSDQIEGIQAEYWLALFYLNQGDAERACECATRGIRLGWTPEFVDLEENFLLLRERLPTCAVLLGTRDGSRPPS